MPHTTVMAVVLAGMLLVSVAGSVYIIRKYQKMFIACVTAAVNIGRERIMKDWTLLATGESGDIDMEAKWLSLAQEAYNIFAKKHHDYGKGNLSATGLIGLIIRMGDKIARLWTLVVLSNGNKVANESVKDTLVDLLNYVFIALMFISGAMKETNMDITVGADARARLIVDIYGNMSEEERDRLMAALMATDIASDIGGNVIL